MAPAYVNLFMERLEEKLKEHGKPYVTKRFHDVIFVIWTGFT